MEVHRHRTSVDASEGDAIEVTQRSTPRGFTWQVANTSSRAVSVRSVTTVCHLGDLSGRIRMFRNGWQSASDTSVAILGVDRDPALSEGALDLQVSSHHADARRPRPDRLRSEMVTVVADDRGAVLAGFLGGDRHDGTVWLAHGQTGQELRLEAFLGGAVLGPGEVRDLHEVWVHAVDDPSAALEEWAGETGRRSQARVDGAQQVGWSSWYRYFGHIRELDVRENVAAAADWPVDVIRIDDGHQSAVGDWLTSDDSFPSGLAAMATTIDASGRRPGIWLAPFLAAPDSRLAVEHPDWIARTADGVPLIAMYDAHWGGFVHALDTSNPAVLDHLRRTGAALVDMGFTHLELDVTHAPAMPGVFADAAMTPAQRVRAGYDAVREGVGDGTFITGCGPLGAAVGVVDAMRIGADVAPWWTPRRDLWEDSGYLATIPAVVNAWRNTLTRAFMHRRLWQNDPDCIVLGGEESDLDDEQRRAWAAAVGVSGGSVTVSDDLGSLTEGDLALFSETVDLGRRCDAVAAAAALAQDPASARDTAAGGPGSEHGPRCGDLMQHSLPTRLTTGGVHLEAEPERGSARIISS